MPAAMPRLRWGQGKERLYVTVAVRSLDRSSVRIDFKEDRMSVLARDTQGQRYAISLELAQDILADDCHWEHLQRPDRWGDAVLATLRKKFPDRWSALAADPTSFRKVIDKDWSREAQELEPPELDSFFGEHKSYLQVVNADKLEVARHGVNALVLLPRHAACDQCRGSDDTFAKVAKKVARKPKKDADAWRVHVRLAVLDVRHERLLSRRLGITCAAVAPDCRYIVIPPRTANPSDVVNESDDVQATFFRIRGRHKQETLIAELESLAREQLQHVATAVARREDEGRGRGLVVLAPHAPMIAVQAAQRLLLCLDFTVANVSETDELGLGNVARHGPLAILWPPKETDGMYFTDDPVFLESWLRVRSVAPLAEVVSYEDEEPYEDLGLPIARLFLDGGNLNGIEAEAQARSTVRALAFDYLGRVAFITRNGTAKTFDWRQHGLPSGRFPAFAVGMGMHYNASRFAFLDVPRKLPSGFWARDATKHRLVEFLEAAVAGQLTPSLMSEAPPEEAEEETDPARAGSTVAYKNTGAVLSLVGRRCKEVVMNSSTEVLIEGFDEWRRDHRRRTVQLDTLTSLLAPLNITVYRLDFGYNECPKDVIETIPAGYSGYFFAAPQLGQRKLRLQRLKKLDPPFDRVLQFLTRHSEATIDINATLAVLEAAVRHQERVDSLASIAANSWVRSIVVLLLTLLVGATGAVLLLKQRSQRKKASPAAAGAEGPKTDDAPPFEPANMAMK
eukprot:TRINITY_DN63244_c0_g1_i1.p1 TRINITY_DN63244_c0_g1~~TRINITY_DN63244_c0_g1_i1.p1  ORF type:complete len:783 (-),score=126.82 TRINITY_DN63244_c0_g1_i1:2-2209(-)